MQLGSAIPLARIPRRYGGALDDDAAAAAGQGDSDGEDEASVSAASAAGGSAGGLGRLLRRSLERHAAGVAQGSMRLKPRWVAVHAGELQMYERPPEIGPPRLVADLAGADPPTGASRATPHLLHADGAVVRLRAADAPTMGAWADAVEKLGTLACVERDSVLPTPVPVGVGELP